MGSVPSIGVGGRIAVIPISGIIESERLFVERLQRYADDGSVRGYINLFLNGADVRHLDAADRTVSRDSVLSIVPSVAGG